MNIIGWFMIALFFVVLFVAFARIDGWKETAKIFGLAILGTTFFVVAALLITGGWK